MLDVGWPELIVIGAVALVAVGPEDFPKVMHSFGRFARRARTAMHDFRMLLDQMAREAEIAEKNTFVEKDSERKPDA